MNMTGVLLSLDDLSDHSYVTEKWLAQQLNKCHETIRRWKRRGTLPPTISMGYDQVWTIGVLKLHFTGLLEKAAAERERDMKRLHGSMPGMV